MYLKKSDKTDEAYNGKQCRCNFLQFANDIQRETDNIKYLSYNAKLRGSLENGLKTEMR